METLAEMRERHRRERETVMPQLRRRQRRELRETLESLAARGLTQSEAAQLLGVRLTTINNIIHRDGIAWPVKRQGVPSRKVNGISLMAAE